jgi:hypothetical protein
MRASPDVESVPPEPMPPALPPAGAAPARGGGVAWARVVTLVLAWGFFFSLVYLSWARVVAVPGMERVGIDMWLALATLLVTVGVLLRWTWRSVSPAHLARGRVKGDSQWAIAGRHFKKNKLAMAGLAVMIILYLVTLLTPLVAPYDPAAQGDIITSRYLAPSSAHWLGTDKFGRDILSRVLYGARISLSIGFVAVGISMTLGTLIGAVAGYFGGWVDSVLMRFTDMMLAFPRLVLLIVVIAVFESPSIWLVVVVLGLTGWMGTSRIVRGEVLSLREREFVQARDPKHHGARDRVGHAGHRPHHPHGGVAVVPGAGRAAAHAQLGQHGGRRPRRAHGGVVDRHLPGPGHRAHGGGVQPAGRRPARRAGPAPADVRQGMGALDFDRGERGRGSVDPHRVRA